MAVAGRGRHRGCSDLLLPQADVWSVGRGELVFGIKTWCWVEKNWTIVDICGKQRTTTDRTLNELWQEDRSLLLMFESYVSGWIFFLDFFLCPGKLTSQKCPDISFEQKAFDQLPIAGCGSVCHVVRRAAWQRHPCVVTTKHRNMQRKHEEHQGARYSSSPTSCRWNG